MHQSWPGSRRRRVSQPSIHLPVATYSSRSTGAAATTRFSQPAKNSSLAALTAPPTRSLARSMSWESAMVSVLVSVVSVVVSAAQEEAPGWPLRVLSLAERDLTAHQRGVHHPEQRLAMIRRERVIVVQARPVDG